MPSVYRLRFRRQRLFTRPRQIIRHGFFDEDPRLRGTEDFELWMRLSPHATFAYVEPVYVPTRLVYLPPPGHYRHWDRRRLHEERRWWKEHDGERRRVWKEHQNSERLPKCDRPQAKKRREQRIP